MLVLGHAIQLMEEKLAQMNDSERATFLASREEFADMGVSKGTGTAASSSPVRVC